jgi:hypothetical protein
LHQAVRISSITDRIGIPLALNLHDRVKKTVASNRRCNQDHQQPNYYDSSHGILSAPPDTKKADAIAHPKVFDHVGLLVNEPPGLTGLPFI